MLTSSCLNRVLNGFDSYSYYTVGTKIVIAVGLSGDLYCRGLAFRELCTNAGLDSVEWAFHNLLHAREHKLDCICLTRRDYFTEGMRNCVESALGAKCPLYLCQYNVQTTDIEKLLLNI